MALASAIRFLVPESVEEVLTILEEKGPAARVFAGGTDLMVRLRQGAIPDTVKAFVGLDRVPELRRVREEDGEVVIGAAVTAADLLRDPVIRERAPILAEVADRLASPQIRALATIGGNLANASPAGDLINPLLLLDAEVDLRSSNGARRVPVSHFFLGPGETVRRPDELLAAVRFPAPPPERVFRFEKAGTRPAMECSVITVGVAFTPREGVLCDVRVAYGSAAPTPLRGRAAERVLEGSALTPDVVRAAALAAEGEVTPISDVRGGAEYRRILVGEFLRRLLDAS